MSLKSVQLEPSYTKWTFGQAGRQTDMTKLMVDFRRFAKVNSYTEWQMA